MPSDSSTWPDVCRRRLHVNGITLHCMEAGPVTGPAVVMLHGFPEFSYSWRLQIPHLVQAGFHVLAPDLRGYNTSSKPAKVSDYRIEQLVADVAGLMEQECGGRAMVVGHDWGGVIAWYLAMWRPDRVSRLVTLNAPHPVVYLRELRRSAQLLRSWYVLFFQLPWLPEAALRWNDFALARWFYARGPARSGPDACADVLNYLGAIARPRSLASAINYYRAAARRRPSELLAMARPISLPTLVVWGDLDAFLDVRLTEGLEPLVTNLQIEHLPRSTHWVQHDAPDRVNELLTSFLNASC